MNILRFTKQKLSCASSEVRKLKTSDFATSDPEDALTQIDTQVYQADLQRLNALKATDSQDVIKESCLHANRNISRYEELLGFLIRSSNVRNPFEIFDPLLRLARSLLGPDARLILSSEWKFSRFTYPASFRELPLYVFIGLPATEATNSLIVPLAGHELGHSVWRHTPIGLRFGGIIETKVRAGLQQRWSDYERAVGHGVPARSVISNIALCEEISRRQAEEVFCDTLGVALFGAAYLHAFEYLVAPNLQHSVPLHTLRSEIGYPFCARPLDILV